ncbi:MAG: hypothetical protein CBB68_05405 [Rhodospirillaceae bacterium TMED8]|mgnify:CR=1 FL=1|nr:cysteine desulfurase [Magnetovibrio sp.]OUT51432.1 MAG: hypothetical protein CBB68_05405 [Rhodospirillaceae bacterium TMED8]
MSANNVAYLDHNATSPARQAVIDAVSDTMRSGAINPSSAHSLGREARRLIDDARDYVAGLAGSASDQVVFTGGGTEANNMVICGAGRSRVLISAVEHSAVLKTAISQAVVAELIPVSTDGLVDLEALDRMLREDNTPALVSIMAANNETGALQPVEEAAKIARRHGALMHTDAVQMAGKLQLLFEGWDVDFLTLSAHKIGGPQGVGALICRSRGMLRPLLLGGSQENGIRAGTENVPGIVGFGVAAHLAHQESQNGYEQLERMRDGMEASMKKNVEGATVFSKNVPRLPNTTCVTMPGVRSDTQVIAMDLAGVAVSAGSACSAGKVEPSHVLEAMGVPTEQSTTAIRVSLGTGTLHPHIDKFIEEWLALWRRHKTRCDYDKARPAA